MHSQTMTDAEIVQSISGVLNKKTFKKSHSLFIFSEEKTQKDYCRMYFNTTINALQCISSDSNWFVSNFSPDLSTYLKGYAHQDGYPEMTRSHYMNAIHHHSLQFSESRFTRVLIQKKPPTKVNQLDENTIILVGGDLQTKTLTAYWKEENQIYHCSFSNDQVPKLLEKLSKIDKTKTEISIHDESIADRNSLIQNIAHVFGCKPKVIAKINYEIRYNYYDFNDDGDVLLIEELRIKNYIKGEDTVVEPKRKDVPMAIIYTASLIKAPNLEASISKSINISTTQVRHEEHDTLHQVAEPTVLNSMGEEIAADMDTGVFPFEIDERNTNSSRMVSSEPSVTPEPIDESNDLILSSQNSNSSHQFAKLHQFLKHEIYILDPTGKDLLKFCDFSNSEVVHERYNHSYAQVEDEINAKLLPYKIYGIRKSFCFLSSDIQKKTNLLLAKLNPASSWLKKTNISKEDIFDLSNGLDISLNFNNIHWKRFFRDLCDKRFQLFFDFEKMSFADFVKAYSEAEKPFKIICYKTNDDISLDELDRISKTNNGFPVLIIKEDQVSLYGCVKTEEKEYEWKISQFKKSIKIDEKILEKLELNKPLVQEKSILNGALENMHVSKNWELPQKNNEHYKKYFPTQEEVKKNLALFDEYDIDYSMIKSVDTLHTLTEFTEDLELFNALKKAFNRLMEEFEQIKKSMLEVRHFVSQTKTVKSAPQVCCPITPDEFNSFLKSSKQTFTNDSDNKKQLKKFNRYYNNEMQMRQLHINGQTGFIEKKKFGDFPEPIRRYFLQYGGGDGFPNLTNRFYSELCYDRQNILLHTKNVRCDYYLQHDGVVIVERFDIGSYATSGPEFSEKEVKKPYYTDAPIASLVTVSYVREIKQNMSLSSSLSSSSSFFSSPSNLILSANFDQDRLIKIDWLAPSEYECIQAYNAPQSIRDFVRNQVVVVKRTIIENQAGDKGSNQKEELTAYWIDKRELKTKSLPKEEVQDIWDRLAELGGDKKADVELTDDIILKYGCDVIKYHKNVTYFSHELVSQYSKIYVFDQARGQELFDMTSPHIEKRFAGYMNYKTQAADVKKEIDDMLLPFQFYTAVKSFYSSFQYSTLRFVHCLEVPKLVNDKIEGLTLNEIVMAKEKKPLTDVKGDPIYNNGNQVYQDVLTAYWLNNSGKLTKKSLSTDEAEMGSIVDRVTALDEDNKADDQLIKDVISKYNCFSSCNSCNPYDFADLPFKEKLSWNDVNASRPDSILCFSNKHEWYVLLERFEKINWDKFYFQTIENRFMGHYNTIKKEKWDGFERIESLSTEENNEIRKIYELTKEGSELRSKLNYLLSNLSQSPSSSATSSGYFTSSEVMLPLLSENSEKSESDELSLTEDKHDSHKISTIKEAWNRAYSDYISAKNIISNVWNIMIKPVAVRAEKEIYQSTILSYTNEMDQLLLCNSILLDGGLYIAAIASDSDFNEFNNAIKNLMKETKKVMEYLNEKSVLLDDLKTISNLNLLILGLVKDFFAEIWNKLKAKNINDVKFIQERLLSTAQQITEIEVFITNEVNAKFCSTIKTAAWSVTSGVSGVTAVGGAVVAGMTFFAGGWVAMAPAAVVAVAGGALSVGTGFKAANEAKGRLATAAQDVLTEAKKYMAKLEEKAKKQNESAQKLLKLGAIN